MTQRAVTAFSFLVLALCCGVASAQGYPARPITLIVPFATGGTTDIVSRVVAHELTSSLGRQVLVENRTGGGGVVGWSAAARAAPDGYTLLAQELSYAIAAGLIPTLPFDPRKSLTPVTTVASVPHVMVVHPSVKATTVKELIALAKASPGKLFYGSGGNGTNSISGASSSRISPASISCTCLTKVPAQCCRICSRARCRCS